MKNILQMNYWTLGGFEGKKPVAQALEEAAAMGLGGLELTYGAGEFPRGITEAQCRAIRAKAKQLNIRIETLVAGYYWDCSLSSADAAERREAIAFTKEYLRVAAWVGARVVLVVPGAVVVHETIIC